jgi:hypothetical protein
MVQPIGLDGKRMDAEFVSSLYFEILNKYPLESRR